MEKQLHLLKLLPAMGASMRITVNDREQDVPDDCTVPHILERLVLARDGTAVAVNDAVVPRSQWDGHVLTAGDRVLVIQAAQGG